MASLSSLNHPVLPIHPSIPLEYSSQPSFGEPSPRSPPRSWQIPLSFLQLRLFHDITLLFLLLRRGLQPILLHLVFGQSSGSSASSLCSEMSQLDKDQLRTCSRFDTLEPIHLSGRSTGDSYVNLPARPGPSVSSHSSASSGGTLLDRMIRPSPPPSSPPSPPPSPPLSLPPSPPLSPPPSPPPSESGSIAPSPHRTTTIDKHDRRFSPRPRRLELDATWTRSFEHAFERYPYPSNFQLNHPLPLPWCSTPTLPKPTPTSSQN